MSVKSLTGLALVSVIGLAVAGCNTTPQPAPDQITTSLGVSLEFNKICQTDNARKLPRCNRAEDYTRDADVSAAAYQSMAKDAGNPNLRVKVQESTSGAQQ